MRVAGIYLPKCCEQPQFDISKLFCNFAALLLEEKGLPKKRIISLGGKEEEERRIIANLNANAVSSPALPCAKNGKGKKRGDDIT